jgi:hypothetical protein
MESRRPSHSSNSGPKIVVLGVPRPHLGHSNEQKFAIREIEILGVTKLSMQQVRKIVDR